jgi:ribonuclease III
MIYQELQARLGHTFNKPELLESALTHRSYYFENKATSPQHFERLEFLGDAVLGLVVSNFLMRAFLQQEEGELTKWRASLVNEATLAEIAKELELQNLLRLGKSEDHQRNLLSSRVLSSALEAIFGAVYMDAGFAVAQELVEKLFQSRFENLDPVLHFAADFKTRFQEYCQKYFKHTPTYKLISSEGPDHAKFFNTEVSVGSKVLAVGRGGSRRASEQEAARLALEGVTL